MIELQPKTYINIVKAEAVTRGHKFLTRSRTHSAAVVSTAVELDDFGTPALILATLEDGTTVRIAHGSTIRVVSNRPKLIKGTALALDDLELIPAEEGTPEAVIVAVARAHPDRPKIQRIAARLSRGLNTKSGSNLQDVRDLAHALFVDLEDKDNALIVCRLITDLPFDGNFGRWKWIQSALALAAYISYDAGELAAAERFAEALRAPDAADDGDPFRAKVSATVRQRQMNEPNLYDKEIHRAMAAVDKSAERDWRVLRLGVLMFLHAHGGSETLDPPELDRRISNELIAIRALN